MDSHHTPRQEPHQEVMHLMGLLLRAGAKVDRSDGVRTDDDGTHLTAHTDRVTVRATFPADGECMSDWLPFVITVDDRTVPPPARWSGLFSLVSNPDVLLIEHITDTDSIRVEVSGDSAQTWTPHSTMTGSQAREFAEKTIYDHHGHMRPDTGCMVIRSTYLNETFGRHAWRFTRETGP
ncbi:hypothetical protein [Streptomyces sp. NPDC088727]|uniref:hypothetical protein n=1 Tax=Streptomyces sp. NPDC088727 TaxID=3365875 RepID=UPI003810DE67